MEVEELEKLLRKSIDMADSYLSDLEEETALLFLACQMLDESKPLPDNDKWFSFLHRVNEESMS